MKILHAVGPLAAIFVCIASFAADAQGAPPPQYVPFGQASAAIWRPADPTHTAFVVMHRTGNFMNHIACKELSARGFMVVCISPEQSDEATVDWNRIMRDVKAGVDYARKQPGITKVVLFGHSGGGAVMTGYQATAEKGTAYCAGPNKIVSCKEADTHMTAADAVVLADFYPGDPIMEMRNLDPAVSLADDGATFRVDPALDPFSPENGFNPVGSHYSKDFLKRFTQAQAAEMNNLIDRARKQQATIKDGGINKLGQEYLMVPTTKESVWLSRINADNDDFRYTARPEKLLKNDGTIVTQMFQSVSVTTAGFSPGGTMDKEEGFKTSLWTADSFLAAHAVRATDSQGAIDYCTTNASSICAVQYVTVPTMIFSMGGYLFPHDSERLYDHSAAADKDFVLIEGALHTFAGCKPCEKTPGQYSNSVKNLFDYIRDWTNKRFAG